MFSPDIYCSIIQSNLIFSILAWGYDCNRLVKLQKKIVRVISCSNYNAHTEPLFKVLKLLNVQDILKINTLKFCFKLQNNNLPIYFRSYHYRTQQEIHGRDTRYNYLIPTNLVTTQRAEKCLRNNIPWIINSIPRNLLEKMNTHSYQGFSQNAKKYYLDQYSYECRIPDCFSCRRQQYTNIMWVGV